MWCSVVWGNGIHVLCLSRLSQDLINEKYPDVKFCLLRTLDFLHCNLKTVDLSPVDAFDNLARFVYISFLDNLNITLLCMTHNTSLNLEHNSLSSFSGLIYLNNLKVFHSSSYFWKNLVTLCFIVRCCVSTTIELSVCIMSKTGHLQIEFSKACKCFTWPTMELLI